MLHGDKQLDAADEAVSRAIDLLPEEGEQFLVCDGHRILGNISRSKGNTKKAIHHFEVALGIASSFNWHDVLFWIHYALAQLFLREGRFDDVQTRIERTKSHAVDNPYYLGRAMELQARIWYKRRMFEEAKSEALRALDVFEKLGAANDAELSGVFLRDIDRNVRGDGLGSKESDDDGEPPNRCFLPLCIESSCSAASE